MVLGSAMRPFSIDRRHLRSSSTMRGRVFAVRTLKSSKKLSRSEWLDNLVVVTKLVHDAGELAPFPYIKFTASVILRVLEVIRAGSLTLSHVADLSTRNSFQLVQKNRDDFEELAKSIVDIIVNIRDVLLAHPGVSDLCSNFALRCNEFTT